MGIHGIYKEIGAGERIALSKLAAQKFEQAGRPLRLAIDTSIWLFQIQSGKGGTNPALRTFFYRLLRLLSLSIHPLFVFDGPNKPPFKRSKRTGQNIASVPDFLAKQLLQQFGFPYHRAPGEAEAECALLQQKGIVDAVLSEDVDTLMFGSGITLRNWSPEMRANGTPTHINVYHAQKIKAGSSQLDPKGMILIGLMSGGDYTPQGIPGCGPKIACEAARAGFGAELCAIPRRDKPAIRAWRDRLAHELKTNESKHFRQKHKTLEIPEDFPSLEVLGYYTNPAISDDAAVKKLKDTIKWDQDIDLVALRAFTADAFDWTKLQGAKHFIRNLAPATLIKRLRLIAENAQSRTGDPEAIQEQESKLVQKIYAMRNHPTTDNCVELRLGFMPLDLVPLNLEDEEPDGEDDSPEAEMDEDGPVEDEIDNERPESTSKKRTPTNYDPSKVDRVWVLDTFVKAGVPLMIEDWEENTRATERLKQAKAAKSQANKTSRQLRSPKSKKTGGMSQGALYQYAKVTKPSDRRTKSSTASQMAHVEEVDLSALSRPSGLSLESSRTISSEPTQSQPIEPNISTIDLCSSPAPFANQIITSSQAPVQLNFCIGHTAFDLLPNEPGRRKRSPFRRSISTPESRRSENINTLPRQAEILSPPQAASAIVEDDQLEHGSHVSPSLPVHEGGLSQAISPPQTPPRRAVPPTVSRVSLLSSPSKPSPGKQRGIQDFFPSSQQIPGFREAEQDTSCEFRMPHASRYSKGGSNSSNQRTMLGETSGSSQNRSNNHRPSDDSSSLEQDCAGRKKGKRTLELRESLDGTWKISKMDRLEAQSNYPGKTTSASNASKRRLGDAGRQSWRLSDVEVLDLT